MEGRRAVTGKNTWELSGWMVMFCVLIGVLITWVYIHLSKHEIILKVYALHCVNILAKKESPTLNSSSWHACRSV